MRIVVQQARGRLSAACQLAMTRGQRKSCGVRGGADYKLLLCLGFLFLGEGKGKEEGGRGGVYVLTLKDTACLKPNASCVSNVNHSLN